MDSEDEIIERALAGDQAAFGRLVQTYQAPVYNLAYRMLGSAGEAEEAAQEAFLRAYRRLDTYRPGCKFSSWLLAIAAHYCVDRLRRRRIVSVALDEAPEADVATPPVEGPEPTFLDRERQREIQALLAQLPESYRAALVLRYWHELSYEEMAQVLGTSEKAIKSRLHRARELLATYLPQARAEGRAERRPVLAPVAS